MGGKRKPKEAPVVETESTETESTETESSGGGTVASGKFICSKLASDNAYTVWVKRGKNDMPQKKRQVLVKGGAGIANKNLITPHGVVTAVTDEEHELLVDQCPSFNRHVDAGYIKVLDRNPDDQDIKSIASDLSIDPSAPLKDGAAGKK